MELKEGFEPPLSYSDPDYRSGALNRYATSAYKNYEKITEERQ
jgi:hypothetical protein